MGLESWFGFGKNKGEGMLQEEPGRQNDGSNFMAVPDQNLDTSDAEGAAANERRERREFLERMIENIEGDQEHPDRTNGNYEKYQEELRELQ
jgi:hypothetical protein